MKADYNVWWNIRFDFGAIVKPWAVTQAPRLKENHRRAIAIRKTVALIDGGFFVEGKKDTETRRVRRQFIEEERRLESVEHFDLGKYRVMYIPKKGFRITRTARKRGKNSVTFFDAMPFYSTGIEETAGLDRIARQYLGEHKTAEEEGIDVVQIGSVVGYYEANRDAILRYCFQDATLTAKLFRLTIDGFERIGCPFPKQPWSRASVGREYLKRSGVLESTRERYKGLKTSGASRLWENAYAGACILTRGVGAWPDVSRWDKNSAYPEAMAEFPSLDGAYVVSDASPEFDGCYFKFYEVMLRPTPRRALPAKDGGEDRLLYVHGGPERRAFVTAYELQAFDAWGDEYRILSAVGIVTPSKDRPLAYMIDLYARKSKIKIQYGEKSVEYQNIKVMLASTYGILTQSRPREGRFTNFIYGAYITSRCRRDLWLKALELERQGGTVLNYMTDGLFVSGLASLPEPSTALGGWDVEDVGLTVLFANGIYLSKGKLKRRGAADLTVDALLAADGPSVTTNRSRPLGLKAGIIQARPEDIGVFFDETKELTPASMLESTGLRMVPELRDAPLAAYFTRSWFLEHRSAAEIVEPTSKGIYTVETLSRLRKV